MPAVVATIFCLSLFGSGPIPESALRVHIGTEWRSWWRSAENVHQWTHADPILSRGANWRVLREGVEMAEVRISGDGEAKRLRVVVVRFDPALFSYALHERKDEQGRPVWAADSIPAAAVLSFNIGQFRAGNQWGWLVEAGRERQARGNGPLASTVIFNSDSRAMLLSESAGHRIAANSVALGFQSYPTLLSGGEVPLQLRAAGRGVDLAHRDSRFALGTLRDGRILLALTRFDGLDGRLEEFPAGVTVPEMAAIMGGLGADNAVMLDGGISGQLAFRDAQGRLTVKRAWRKVPVGLVVTPRSATQ